MSSLIKNAKFGVAGALMLAAVLIAACGGTEQLDYPENWPAEFAQQVHDDFDGFFNSVKFTDPLPPTEDTLAELKEMYDDFMCCALDGISPPFATGHLVTKIGHVVDENGRLRDVTSSDTYTTDEIYEHFLSGGFDYIKDDGTTALIPFDQIVWLEGNMFKDVLVAHYKRGNDSPLCKFASVQKEELESWERERLEYYVPEWWCSA